jgi:hypothetical protein
VRCHLENSPRPEDNNDIVVRLSSLYLFSQASSSCISIQGIRDSPGQQLFINRYDTAHLRWLAGFTEKMKPRRNSIHVTILGLQPRLTGWLYLQQSG